ncbi:MAG: elongation factor G [Deltaproteobacteria bacterium]|nr:MAG: elongation factor G [Deltaproteobacteria bacterium]
MQDKQNTNMVRNIAIIGHGNCGKTSLAEAMLYTAGKTTRLGKVDDGSSVLDYDEEEIKRNISINSSFYNYSWKKHEVHLIDTPGDDNFINETVFATQICDSAVFTIGAALGVRGQTIKFADMVEKNKLPCLIVVNKMDRERADFQKTVADIKEQLPLKPVVVHLPIGAEDDFRGFIDVITEKAYLFEGDKGGFKEADIPGELADELASHREQLMESVAETDDELLEKFFEEEEISTEECLAAIKNAVARGEIAPVSVCSAVKNLGTQAVMDLINQVLPSPLDKQAISGTTVDGKDAVERKPEPDEPFSALVFKTMADPYAGRLTIFRIFSGTLTGDSFYNSSKETVERFGQLYLLEGKEQKPVDEAGPGMIVAVAKLKETSTGDTLCDQADPILIEPPVSMEPVISYAVGAKKGDEEKLFGSITKMLEEDLTLRLVRQPQTREVLISGVGKVHLEVVGSKIKRKFGVEMELSIPKIPYMETIRGSAKVQGKHKKQSGGRGQYGDCWIEISANPGKGYEFEDKIVGGVIPQQYRPAVDKGIQEAMEKGVLAGYPLIDVKVVLYDGSFHNVDSSEMAFKIAGSLAFKKGAQEAGLVLLEPIMDMVVKVGKDHVGDIMGDLNARRGRVMGMDSDEKVEIINAQVPMAEVQEYAVDLTSMTGGRGMFTVSHSHYEEVPAQIAEKIVAAAGGE